MILLSATLLALERPQDESSSSSCLWTSRLEMRLKLVSELEEERLDSCCSNCCSCLFLLGLAGTEE